MVGRFTKFTIWLQLSNWLNEISNAILYLWPILPPYPGNVPYFWTSGRKCNVSSRATKVKCQPCSNPRCEHRSALHCLLYSVSRSSTGATSRSSSLSWSTAGSGRQTSRRCLPQMAISSTTGPTPAGRAGPSRTTGSSCSRAGRRRPAWPSSTTSTETVSGGKSNWESRAGGLYYFQWAWYNTIWTI